MSTPLIMTQNFTFVSWAECSGGIRDEYDMGRHNDQNFTALPMIKCQFIFQDHDIVLF